MAEHWGWFWPALAGVLAGLWLWALLRQRGRGTGAQAPPCGIAQRPVEVEDALKAAYMLQETGDAWSDESVARAVGLSTAMADELAKALVGFGWAREDEQGHMRLTAMGEARARELIRAHRLWELYLAGQEGTPLETVHAEAHRREHETTPEELEELDARLGYPAWDPHGHAIPAPGCQVPSRLARSLLEEGTLARRLRVICLDDEPADLLAQLIAMGLKPGVEMEVVEREPHLLRLRLNHEVIPLASAAAGHVYVVPAPALPVPLGELPVGSRARVAEVRGGGRQQRRMLDMGLVPGAEVTVMRKASLGDPVEYGIKGTAIAMRRSDADSILVEEVRDG